MSFMKPGVENFFVKFSGYAINCQTAQFLTGIITKKVSKSKTDKDIHNLQSNCLKSDTKCVEMTSKNFKFFPLITLFCCITHMITQIFLVLLKQTSNVFVPSYVENMIIKLKNQKKIYSLCCTNLLELCINLPWLLLLVVIINESLPKFDSRVYFNANEQIPKIFKKVTHLNIFKIPHLVSINSILYLNSPIQLVLFASWNSSSQISVIVLLHNRQFDEYFDLMLITINNTNTQCATIKCIYSLAIPLAMATSFAGIGLKHKQILETTSKIAKFQLGKLLLLSTYLENEGFGQNITLKCQNDSKITAILKADFVVASCEHEPVTIEIQSKKKETNTTVFNQCREFCNLKPDAVTKHFENVLSKHVHLDLEEILQAFTDFVQSNRSISDDVPILVEFSPSVMDFQFKIAENLNFTSKLPTVPDPNTLLDMSKDKLLQLQARSHNSNTKISVNLIIGMRSQEDVCRRFRNKLLGKELVQYATNYTSNHHCYILIGSSTKISEHEKELIRDLNLKMATVDQARLFFNNILPETYFKDKELIYFQSIKNETNKTGAIAVAIQNTAAKIKLYCYRNKQMELNKYCRENSGKIGKLISEIRNGTHSPGYRNFTIAKLQFNLSYQTHDFRVEKTQNMKEFCDNLTTEWWTPSELAGAKIIYLAKNENGNCDSIQFLIEEDMNANDLYSIGVRLIRSSIDFENEAQLATNSDLGPNKRAKTTDKMVYNTYLARITTGITFNKESLMSFEIEKNQHFDSLYLYYATQSGYFSQTLSRNTQINQDVIKQHLQQHPVNQIEYTIYGKPQISRFYIPCFATFNELKHYLHMTFGITNFTQYSLKHRHVHFEVANISHPIPTNSYKLQLKGLLGGTNKRDLILSDSVDTDEESQNAPNNKKIKLDLTEIPGNLKQSQELKRKASLNKIVKKPKQSDFLSSNFNSILTDPPSNMDDITLPDELDTLDRYNVYLEHDLSIIQYNCNGFKKLENNQEICNILEYNPHLIALQETQTDKPLSNLPNYKQIHLPHSKRQYKQHLFINNSIKNFKQIHVSDNCYIYEVNKQKIAFIYIPYAFYLAKDFAAIKRILQPAIDHKAIIIGDLNFHLLAVDDQQNALDKILVQYLENNCFQFHNRHETSMVKSQKILDHCWSHTSQISKINSHNVLNRPEAFTSDHWPSLIKLKLDTPIIDPEKVNWKKLKLAHYRRKYKAVLNKLLNKHQIDLLNKTDSNFIDLIFSNCILTAGRITLGIIPRFNANVNRTKDIQSINKKIKINQRKFKRTRNKSKKKQLLKQIQQSRAFYNAEAKKQVIETQLEVVEELFKDPNAAYHKLCEIKNKISKTNLFCDIQDMLDYQKQHFNHRTHEWIKQELTETEKLRTKLVISQLFTTNKIKSELKYLNIKKASGGLIPTIAYKFLPRNGIKTIISLSYFTGEIPNSWSESGIVEIFKNKGSSEDPKYYRPISLLVPLRKLYEKIIYYHRLKNKLIPSYRQHGFCASRSTNTQLHYVHNLINQFKKEGNVIMGSLDLSSAFDGIIYDDIYSIASQNLEKHDLNALRSLLVNQSLHLLRDNNKQNVKMKKGVPQGGTLSPMLFSFVIDKVLSELDYDPTKLAICLYADDIFLISNDPKYFEMILNKLTDLFLTFSFEPNPDKYQICSNEPVNIKINDQIIKQSPWIKYLGVHLDHTGICYEQELKWKKSKLAFLSKKFKTMMTEQQTSSKKFEKVGHLFHGKSLFAKGVIESVLSYGLSLWDKSYLSELESIRRVAINGLFSNTRLIHEYLCKFKNTEELHLTSRISSEKQLINFIEQLESNSINTPQSYLITIKHNTSFSEDLTTRIELECANKEDLNERIDERLDRMWNENSAKRATRLPLDSALMVMLKKHKYHYNYTHHVLKLGIKLIMGDFPFRNGACTMCNQPYDSLFHFEGECLNNYMDWSEDSIYEVLNNGNCRLFGVFMVRCVSENK
eukprot:NODE_560_length_6068_cov_0.517005.p1 type:complete len:1953 gc:universal NODE_560_length_6068_cov_0.517005:181-6039(+)